MFVFSSHGEEETELVVLKSVVRGDCFLKTSFRETFHYVIDRQQQNISGGWKQRPLSNCLNLHSSHQILVSVIHTKQPT